MGAKETHNWPGLAILIAGMAAIVAAAVYLLSSASHLALPSPVGTGAAAPSPSPTIMPVNAPFVKSTPTALPQRATPTPEPAVPPEAEEDKEVESAPTPQGDDPPKEGEEKWIEVILSQQRLVAYEDGQPVFEALVSTGVPRYPTVTGRYRIYLKLLSDTMTGPGYYLPNVPYVMYFYRGYALHGTYWHNNFGQPMSHGCVNLRTEDAKWLFEWTEPRLPPGAQYVYASQDSPGTLVIIRH